MGVIDGRGIITAARWYGPPKKREIKAVHEAAYSEIH